MEEIELKPEPNDSRKRHFSVNSIRKRWHTMPLKARKLFVIRTGIIMFCVIGFILNVSQLAHQYLQYQTYVNTKFTEQAFSVIPAFTICYPTFLSMELMAKKYPELQPTYRDYVKTLQNIPHNQLMNETVQDELFYKYYGVFASKFNHLRDISFESIENISIPFERFVDANNATIYPVDIQLTGVKNDEHGYGKAILTDHEPIESYQFDKSREGLKCFTFFSHLNPKWRPFSVLIERVIISIAFSAKWFPVHNKWLKVAGLAVHSPNVMPQLLNLNSFVVLTIGRALHINYNRWKTVLQPRPFQTKCRHYDLDDNEYPENRLRADCLNKCFFDFWSDNCPACNLSVSYDCTRCIHLSDRLWRSQNLYTNPLRVCEFPTQQFTYDHGDKHVYKVAENEQLQNCHEQLFYKIGGVCMDKCGPECVNRYYNLEVKAKQSYDRPHLWISIDHDQLPDQETEHIPEMTFIDLVSNFGGLLGMWLGLSALAILSYALRQFK